MNLIFRKADLADLRAIVNLLTDDDLGVTRESSNTQLDDCYIEAFKQISRDSNQYLMVVLNDTEIIGTCHLTIMPSLTYKGATRMQIEAVRVAKKYRSQGVGEKMMMQALQYAESKKVKIVQLTTNKLRDSAKKFYERIGFTATHEGMKLFLS